MKLIAKAYATKREFNVQEVVYNNILQLWLRKIFPAIVFAITNLPENCFRVWLSEQETKELLDKSTEVLRKIWLIDIKIDRLLLFKEVNIWLLTKCVIQNFYGITSWKTISS